VRKDPKAAMAKIEEWTKIEKEVAYIFLGPSGIHTLDPTIKPKWIETIGIAYGVLQKMGRVKEFNAAAWVNERYVQQAYKELGLDYEKQKASFAGYEITGQDTLCNAPIRQPREAGQVWIEGGDIVPFSSTLCTLAGVRKLQSEGRKIGVAYVFDRTLGIQLFADKAFYAVNTANPKQPSIVPFLLKKDAEAHVAKNGGKLASYTEALAAANIGR
jgi:NitT/TauT family transport system substrate-binding protein